MKFECPTSSRGVMVVAGANSPVPELEYSIRQRGWYAIYFGIYSMYHESRLRVRLKRDRAFVLITANKLVEQNIDWNRIQYTRHLYDSFEDRTAARRDRGALF